MKFETTYMGIMLCGVCWLLVGCRSEVLEGLGEGEANEIVMRLSETGIDVYKERVGGDHASVYRVTVPRDQMAEAVRSLDAVGLPRTRHEGFAAVYKDRALVPGRFEEQALFVSALQEELSKTLESVQGVLWSRVHVTLQPRVHALGLKRSQPVQVQSASVLLGYMPKGKASPPLEEKQVQKLVANAVQGLEPSKVAVVFSPVEHPVQLPSEACIHEADFGILRWVLLCLAVVALGVAILMVLRRYTRRRWNTRE